MSFHLKLIYGNIFLIKLILLIKEVMDQVKKKIVASSIPLKGHSLPILKIAQALSQRNYEVIYMTSQSSINKIKEQYPSLTVLGFEDNVQALPPDQEPIKLLAEISNKWTNQMKKEILRIQPQIILADFATMVPINLAKELKIKLVVNLTKTNSNSTSRVTFLIYSPQSWLLSWFLKDIVDGFNIIMSNLVLVNSFPGLQEATSIPPNLKFTGPLVSSGPDKQLETDLQQWIGKMRFKKKDIVYITFGSTTDLSEEFIQNMYDGIKRTNYAFLWSLKKGELPQKNEYVFIKKWLPQEHLLQLPQVKAVISHCGWGGVLECVAAAKPIIAAPGRGDQPNALMIVQRQLGLALYEPSFISSATISCKFEPWELEQKLNQIITNPIYSDNMKKMKVLAEQAGGIEKACTQIDKAIKHGYQHLIDRNFERIRKSKSLLGVITGISVLISLGFLLNKYGFPTKNVIPSE